MVAAFVLKVDIGAMLPMLRQRVGCARPPMIPENGGGRNIYYIADGYICDSVLARGKVTQR
uniref:hypothetical protein n=1 Tax=Ruegeria sp. PR1b TaxID=185588 RepID=UPI00146D5720|nr:hypothetical protein [Ruegeria sp. PR1b]